MSTSFIRAFFAVDLPLEHQQQLGAMMEALDFHLKKNRKHHSSFRWVKPQNLHLTLQFLGQVKEDETATLVRQVSQELADSKPFPIRLGPLEWFPSVYLPHVLSLQVKPHGPLAALSQALGRGAMALGYAIESRPFRAHLTLARVEGLHHAEPELLETFPAAELPEVLVKEVVFFRSESVSGGSVYTRLAGIRL